MMFLNNIISFPNTKVKVGEGKLSLGESFSS
jgi:hypothetical protein